MIFVLEVTETRALKDQIHPLYKSQGSSSSSSSLQTLLVCSSSSAPLPNDLFLSRTAVALRGSGYRQ